MIGKSFEAWGLHTKNAIRMPATFCKSKALVISCSLSTVSSSEALDIHSLIQGPSRAPCTATAQLTNLIRHRRLPQSTAGGLRSNIAPRQHTQTNYTPYPP
ncbi:unnamed protein product, partial [Ectocarpus sp. 12 AP-2014]